MTIDLGPELAAALNIRAQQQGVAPEVLAEQILREKLTMLVPTIEPQDEWERSLLAIAVDCGVSLPNSALSREELYD